MAWEYALLHSHQASGYEGITCQYGGSEHWRVLHKHLRATVQRLRQQPIYLRLHRLVLELRCRILRERVQMRLRGVKRIGQDRA